MKNLSFSLFLVLSISIISNAQEEVNYPSVTFSNGLIDVLIFLPDSAEGYYRGARFDWSGLIGQVHYKNHTYFQEWRGYNGTVNYGERNFHRGTGPCEEFRQPLGYEDSESGNKFLKIGVGILEKDEKPYFFFTQYNILQLGKWKVTKGKNWMQFVQTIETDFGYAYKYTKRVELIKGEPKLKVYHLLENIGEKDIISSTYSHNFIRLDDIRINEDYYAEYPVDVKPAGKFHEAALFEGNKLSIKYKLDEKTNPKGVVDVGDTHDITIGNKKTGTAVRIKGDAKIGTLFMWIWQMAFCPEPIIDINIAPNESFSWQNQYEFIAP